MWRSGDERAEHRSWFWESSAARALEHFEKQPDAFLEDGYYTHVVIEEFLRGYRVVGAESETWYRVPYDPKTRSYAALEPCQSPNPVACNFGLG